MKTRKIKPKMEIEVKLIETVAYSKRSEKIEAHCADCRSTVEFTTPQIAGIMTGSGEREIYKLIESEAIHFIETDRVWICIDSLPGLGGERVI